MQKTHKRQKENKEIFKPNMNEDADSFIIFFVSLKILEIISFLPYSRFIWHKGRGKYP